MCLMRRVVRVVLGYVVRLARRTDKCVALHIRLHGSGDGAWPVCSRCWMVRGHAQTFLNETVLLVLW